MDRNPDYEVGNGERVAVATADGPAWLACQRCGRQALATEWPEVLYDVDGLDPRRCPVCWPDGYGVRPKPVNLDGPRPIPAAVVVRGLGWDDATAVGLFDSIEDARRFRYLHGGVVIPGRSVTWHIES